MRKFARIKLRRDWSEMSTERSFCSNKRTLHCNIFNVFQNDVTLIDKLNYQRIKEPILKFYWSFEFWAYSKQTCFLKYIILFNEDTTPPPFLPPSGYIPLFFFQHVLVIYGIFIHEDTMDRSKYFRIQLSKHKIAVNLKFKYT